MVRITTYIRPHRLEAVKSAIASLGVSGMTVSDVRGTGNSPETPQWFAGEGHLIALPIRSRLEIVVSDELVDQIVEAIIAHTRTGEPGDGKIFLQKVEDALRIRTGERGESAI